MTKNRKEEMNMEDVRFITPSVEHTRNGVTKSTRFVTSSVTALKRLDTGGLKRLSEDAEEFLSAYEETKYLNDPVYTNLLRL
jgi:hypothetical protein